MFLCWTRSRREGRVCKRGWRPSMQRSTLDVVAHIARTLAPLALSSKLQAAVIPPACPVSSSCPLPTYLAVRRDCAWHQTAPCRLFAVRLLRFHQARHRSMALRDGRCTNIVDTSSPSLPTSSSCQAPDTPSIQLWHASIHSQMAI